MIADGLVFDSDDRRWQALERRDGRAVGAFVYGVRTTGVYCRPGCASRRPNRANVAFFDDGEGAERAGFRPCRRCGPAAGKPEDRAASAVVARACRSIEGADRPPSLAGLASAAGLSPSHLGRLFRRVVGVSPREYARGVRARRLRDGLAGGEPVAGAILGAGFGSIGRGYEAAADELGMTPAEYGRGALGESIRFASAPTSLGFVTVAATARGLCSIELGDAREALEARLRDRFPRADLTEAGPDFADDLHRVVALVEGPGLGIDLPLDIRGTAFQRQVWDALRAIPPGSTATYAGVARAIGRPTAARAVARAVGSNDLAVAIPCHRVVRGDGALGGYRWGVDRKRALLDVEGAHPVPPDAEAD